MLEFAPVNLFPLQCNHSALEKKSNIIRIINFFVLYLYYQIKRKMTKKEFIELYFNVKKSLFYKDFSKDLIGYVAKKEKFTFLVGNELELAINKLNNFDINKLWDKKFWGLGISESICAVASEPYSFLNKLRND